MSPTQRHNFRLMLGRVRGLSRRDRVELYMAVRLGPIGLVVAAAARVA